ncbi:MAG: hypothetical protein WCC66_00245 [Rhizobiaceae bacterium]
MSKTARLKIENVLQPGKTYSVDPVMFEAMKTALMKVVPSSPPGMTPAEIQKAVLPHLPQDLFPGGDKVGWWMKAVQLDQEAKGVLVRSEKPPVRLHRS